MHEHIIFSTPIYVGNVNVGDDIIKHVYDTKGKYPSTSLSNIGGWQSPYFNSSDLQYPMTQICNEVIENVKVAYSRYNIARNPELVNFWFNVNKKYNYNSPHAHLRTTFSAVLYLKTPTNCGRIVFHNPAPEFSGKPYLPNQFTSGLFAVDPSVGRLVVFSSDLVHSVEQNLSTDDDDERLSIAFDFD